jgi:hypothetical protein
MMSEIFFINRQDAESAKGREERGFHKLFRTAVELLTCPVERPEKGLFPAINWE